MMKPVRMICPDRECVVNVMKKIVTKTDTGGGGIRTCIVYPVLDMPVPVRNTQTPPCALRHMYVLKDSLALSVCPPWHVQNSPPCQSFVAAGPWMHE